MSSEQKITSSHRERLAVVYLRQSEIETAPNVGNDESAKFIQGVCNKNNELLILVELDKMMSEEEWSDLENI